MKILIRKQLFKKALLVVLFIMAMNKYTSAQTQLPDHPVIGAQVFIEPGQTPEQIEPWFKVLADNHFSVCRIRMFEAYMKDPVDQFYAIGSVVGPHPFPMMVRDFQQVVGEEAMLQFMELTGKMPDNLVACVGGGSNAIGLFSAFLEEENVEMFGVEPSGISFKKGEHAATLTLGSPGLIHGFKCYLLQDDEGRPLPVYSIASGLDYPGVGPQHSYLKDIGRVQYKTINDKEALDAFFTLSREEGIIPALESAHAVAYAMKLARDLGDDRTILVNLSGRGDKDIEYVVKKYGKDYISN